MHARTIVGTECGTVDTEQTKSDIIYYLTPASNTHVNAELVGWMVHCEARIWTWTWIYIYMCVSKLTHQKGVIICVLLCYLV
jgi:hypothetical protein